MVDQASCYLGQGRWVRWLVMDKRRQGAVLSSASTLMSDAG
ncbi:MAG: hypothetical protein AAFY20_06805 [Cyanobacteria bacterium J06639_14]